MTITYTSFLRLAKFSSDHSNGADFVSKWNANADILDALFEARGKLRVVTGSKPGIKASRGTSNSSAYAILRLDTGGNRNAAWVATSDTDDRGLYVAQSNRVGINQKSPGATLDVVPQADEESFKIKSHSTRTNTSDFINFIDKNAATCFSIKADGTLHKSKGKFILGESATSLNTLTEITGQGMLLLSSALIAGHYTSGLWFGAKESAFTVTGKIKTLAGIIGRAIETYSVANSGGMELEFRGSKALPGTTNQELMRMGALGTDSGASGGYLELVTSKRSLKPANPGQNRVRIYVKRDASGTGFDLMALFPDGTEHKLVDGTNT